MTRSGYLYLGAAGIISGLAGTVYVVAATTASSMAGTFTTAENERHAIRGESESARRRASAQYALDREQCDLLKGGRRERCRIAARLDERRSILRQAQAGEKAP